MCIGALGMAHVHRNFDMIEKPASSRWKQGHAGAEASRAYTAGAMGRPQGAAGTRVYG